MFTYSLWIAFCLQFRVISYDSGEPQYRSTSEVEIIVIRNRNPPFFLTNPYQVTIDQNKLYGTSVVNTTADDLDGVCVT